MALGLWDWLGLKLALGSG